MISHQGRRPGSEEQDRAAIARISEILSADPAVSKNAIARQLKMGVSRAAMLIEEWEGKRYMVLIHQIKPTGQPDPPEWQR